MKRLFDSSLGQLTIALEEKGVVSISLYGDQGRVIAESSDEWDNADVVDLLRVEVGLSEPEAQSIGETFLAAAKSEGHEQPPTRNAVVPIVFVLGIVLVIAIGLWTIVTWLV